MRDNLHVRFGLFLAAASLLSYFGWCIAPPWLYDKADWLAEKIFWLWDEIFLESFWQTTMLAFWIWLKTKFWVWFVGTFTKTVFMAVFIPFLVVVTMTALLTRQTRRRIEAYRARKIQQAKKRYRLLRLFFYRLFGSYAFLVIMIGLATTVWMTFTVSWQMVSFIVTLGPLQWLWRTVKMPFVPVVEIFRPLVERVWHGLYHNLPFLRSIINSFMSLGQRVLTDWVPVFYRWQKWIAKRFVRLLIRLRWISGERHMRAKMMPEERRLYDRRRQLERDQREVDRLKRQIKVEECATKRRQQRALLVALGRKVALNANGLVHGMMWRGEAYGAGDHRSTVCVANRFHAKFFLGADLKPTRFEGARACGRPPI